MDESKKPKWSDGPYYVSKFEITAGGKSRTIMDADQFSIAHVGERGAEENHATATLFAKSFELYERLDAINKAYQFFTETRRTRLTPRLIVLLEGIPNLLAEARDEDDV